MTPEVNVGTLREHPDGEWKVYLSLELENTGYTRTMSPTEARLVASLLVNYANQAEFDQTVREQQQEKQVSRFRGLFRVIPGGRASA